MLSDLFRNFDFLGVFSHFLCFLLFSQKSNNLKKNTSKVKNFCSFFLDLSFLYYEKIPRRGKGRPRGGTKLSIMHNKNPNKTRMQHVHLKWPKLRVSLMYKTYRCMYSCTIMAHHCQKVSPLWALMDCLSILTFNRFSPVVGVKIRST